jgi:hypothetical protein
MVRENLEPLDGDCFAVAADGLAAALLAGDRNIKVAAEAGAPGSFI